MIVKLTAENQAQLWNDDLLRLRAKKELHYSIGQHVGLLLERVMALEAEVDRLRMISSLPMGEAE